MDRTFLIAALFSFASISPAFFFKRPYKRDREQTQRNIDARSSRRDFIVFLIVCVLFQLFLSAAVGIINLVVPLYVTQTFNVDKATIGILFSLGMGAATLVAQIPSSILADKYGREGILSYSILPLPIIIVFWPSM